MRKPILIVEFPTYVPADIILGIIEQIKKLPLNSEYHVMAWHSNSHDLRAYVVGANWLTLKFVYGKAIKQIKKLWSDFSGDRQSK